VSQHRSKEEQLRSLGFSREARMTRSVARGSTWQCKPNSQLHSTGVRCMLQVGPEGPYWEFRLNTSVVALPLSGSPTSMSSRGFLADLLD
jgi:hypothetical protein